ncbi:gas vesicle protein K [Natronomonas salina]|uniref:gas vesicle protein K n=1 Tax=Natronomonas salina TaxID=1710540 RepID=UPI0015B754B5|nr:gas vesicle protein K [Natronomonas salina]QLD90577.1 gas vesicle protein K [Natronomonas salina]
MKHIELDDEEGDGGASGLMALVVTVIELLIETMEREAIRRMESGQLDPEEIERLGAQLQALEEEMEAIKADQGIDENVEQLRGDLDSLVSEAVEQVRDQELEGIDG